MSVDPLSLLRQLGGVRGVEPAAPVDGARAAPDGVFEGLLARARGGQLSSGRGVSIDPGVALEFTSEQMQRLADAADRAEAAGASNAIVRIDGALVQLDVAGRRVTAEIDPRHGDVLTGIDAFVEASDPMQEASITRGGMGLPLSLGENASLVRELARLLA